MTAPIPQMQFDQKLQEFLSKPVDYTRYLMQGGQPGGPTPPPQEPTPVPTQVGAGQSNPGAPTSPEVGVADWFTNTLSNLFKGDKGAQAAFLKAYKDRLDPVYAMGKAPGGLVEAKRTLYDWVNEWRTGPSKAPAAPPTGGGTPYQPVSGGGGYRYGGKGGRKAKF